MHPPAVAVPANEFLPHEPDRDHHELEVEPVVPEPQKEVGAEDDRERTEAKNIGLPARPGKQHAEGVRERKLRH